MSMEIEQDILAEAVKSKFLTFLNEFKIINQETNEAHSVYIEEADKMRNNERTTMNVDFEHLNRFYTDLAERVRQEYYRFEEPLRQAVLAFVFNLFPEFAKGKLFFLSFYNMPSKDRIRDLKSTQIGRLVAFTGTCTRTTEVRPELLYGTFMCLECNTVVRNVAQQFRYTKPKTCVNPNCQNSGSWELIVEQSTFSDWQKLRVQENASEIPPGGMPRSMDVILRNEIVDTAKPGDQCVFIGTLLVVPEVFSLLKPGEKSQLTSRSNPTRKGNQMPLEGHSGLKSLGVKDLNFKLIFIASYVQPIQNSLGMVNIRDEDGADNDENVNILEQLSPAEREEILAIKDQPDLFLRMARSISPSIYGHDEIKKGILLMLFGGVNKKTPEGMKLRGDINICVVGDPSTAKSQFLKFVTSFVPRSVYTSGKATSAAGLTASVQRDPENGEFCIEAGALMLADNGICCIDEFDKMDIKDQVAIHEAMEQQTISIAKAGIRATLNARASILAAANPIYGRYDKTKTLKYNLNLSAPIMSRFDLFNVILDECDDYVDFNLANYIVNLHRKKERAINPDFTIAQLQRYIRFARTIKPQLSQEAAEALRNEYIKLRVNDITAQRSAYRITVRQLESLLRLSEALARVHCNNMVTAAYVKEASRLLSNSILKVEHPDLELNFGNEMSIEAPFRTQQTIAEQDQGEAPEASKQVVTFEEYERIKQNLILGLRQKERSGLEDALSQSDLVNWYLDKNIDQIQTTEQAKQLSLVVHGVVQRLIAHEKIVIVVRDSKDYKERLLQLHPNVTDA